MTPHMMNVQKNLYKTNSPNKRLYTIPTSFLKDLKAKVCKITVHNICLNLMALYLIIYVTF